MANDIESTPSSVTKHQRLRTVALALLPGIIAIAAGTIGLTSMGPNSASASVAIAAMQATSSPPAQADNRFVPSSFDATGVVPEEQPATF
jgi:hypothetical protein